MIASVLDRASIFEECDSGDGFVCENDICSSNGGRVYANECLERIDFDPIQYDGSTDPKWGIERLRELAINKKFGETINAHALVSDVAFNFQDLRNATKLERSSALARRASLLRPAQKRVEKLISNLGGKSHRRTWLVPGVNIEIPAQAVEDLIKLIGTTDIIAINPPGTGKNQAYRGEEITVGTLSQQLESANYYGESGGRVSSGSNNIKIGIAEAGGNFNCSHVGWKDWAGGTSRIIDTDLCNSSSCGGSTCNTIGQHTTTVAWVAAGSIEQGQDSAYLGTNTFSQRLRSGVAREAELYIYHWTGSNCGLVTAIEQAVLDGVDVFNISWGGSDCNTARNDCSANAAIVNATNAGMLIVSASGNDAPTAADSFCSVNWPANRPTVMSVSGLNSNSSSVDYSDLLFHTGRSFGNDLLAMFNASLGTLPWLI